MLATKKHENEARLLGILERVEKWRAALPILYAGDLTDYNPDGRKREPHLCHFGKIPGSAKLTGIEIEGLQQGKFQHRLLLATDGRWIVCSFSEHHLSFSVPNEEELRRHILDLLDEELYLQVLTAFVERRKAVATELHQKMAKLASLE